MQATADVDAEFRYAFGECRGALDRTRRTVERSQKSIAGVFDLAALKTGQLGTGDPVVALEQLAPASGAELGRPPRRVDDVGEEDGGQDPVRRVRVTLPGEKLFDLARDRLDVADGRPV